MKRYLYIAFRLFLGFIFIPLIIYVELYRHGRKIVKNAIRDYEYGEPLWPFSKEDYGLILISFLFLCVIIILL